ncbi:methyltransferase domain-containing protein [Algicola sagamiensis]|uniref:class I SAM-dependent methyltransferase n=1 Tax=Algicola sagamiensis TaxID=163869 RepID=UPI0003664F00|nr:class I SAM-dependent methyltransferase [Algicola sagamiensis]
MKDAYDLYRQFAKDKESPTEKVGRFDSQVENEKYIFKDVLQKMTRFQESCDIVLDVGCGCSLPAKELMAYTKKNKQKLYLIDSEEMLTQLDDEPHIHKIEGFFPEVDLPKGLTKTGADIIICYSVFHLALQDISYLKFVDALVTLLAPGGQLLLGDIANHSKKKRFLSSEKGQAFHKAWSGQEEVPPVHWNQLEADILDDSIVLAMMHRYRNMGYETYILPQTLPLPFHYTREDMLICRW